MKTEKSPVFMDVREASAENTIHSMAVFICSQVSDKSKVIKAVNEIMPEAKKALKIGKAGEVLRKKFIKDKILSKKKLKPRRQLREGGDNPTPSGLRARYAGSMGIPSSQTGTWEEVNATFEAAPEVYISPGVPPTSRGFTTANVGELPPMPDGRFVDENQVRAARGERYRYVLNDNRTGFNIILANHDGLSNYIQGLLIRESGKQALRRMRDETLLEIIGRPSYDRDKVILRLIIEDLRIPHDPSNISWEVIESARRSN